jgi:hypothetical protein
MFTKKMNTGPVAELVNHLDAFKALIKEGRVKFRGKRDVGAIFVKLDRTGYIFEQATQGTMYDYRHKLERNVWNAAIYEYDMYMVDLKEALLAAVDEAEVKAETEEAPKEEIKPTEPDDSELSVKELMARAEEEDRIAEETETAEAFMEAEEKRLSESTTKMTEADCRELWRIYRAMQTEYKAMKKIADRWIVDNPEKGCLGITLSIILAPAAGILYFLW